LIFVQNEIRFIDNTVTLLVIHCTVESIQYFLMFQKTPKHYLICNDNQWLRWFFVHYLLLLTLSDILQKKTELLHVY
jgi:hypothetical protein